MLARKMKLELNGTEIGTTPMLITSFSSRINLDLCKTLEIIRKFISGPILLSAYDLQYTQKFPPIDFPEVIFIDSGGYECSIDDIISEVGYYRPDSLTWNRELHLETLKKLKNDIPTVIISYDHPNRRETIEKQIENAKELFDGRDNILKEILIKAEEKNLMINIDKIIENIDSISSFDILGLTEKELGDSLFSRMLTIAKIRKEMDKKGIEMPIHIFGSLDTITTPLYYFSGADIFDSLSWLRFTFYDGGTFYTEGIGSKIHGIHEDINFISMLNLIYNYNYLQELKKDLEKFQSSENFDIFKGNAEFFENTYNELKKEIKE